MKKNVLSILLAMVLVLTIGVPAFGAGDPEGEKSCAEVLLSANSSGVRLQAAASGNCGADGSNVKWKLSGHTLTISGKGEMADYGGGAYWYGHSRIDRVVIKKGVTSIGDHAFNGCSMTSLSLPSSLKQIGWCSFAHCSNLTSVTIPNSVTDLEPEAFYGCSRLKSVTIPGSIKGIGTFAFSDCDSLASVTVCHGVTAISAVAFSHCRNLTSVILPASIKTIGELAFVDCGKLTSVVLPESVADVRGDAFRDCSSLKSITVLNPSCDLSISSGGTNLGVPGRTVIYGRAGSTAQAYARKWGYTFRTLSAQPLAVPKITKVAKAANGIKISWKRVPGAAKYRVFYKTSPNGKWIKNGDTVQNTFTRKTVSNGKTYWFTVRCISKDGKSYTSSYDKTGKKIKYTSG